LYFQDSKIVTFQIRGEEKLKIEIIKDLKKKLADIATKRRIVQDIEETTKKIWGDPREAAEKWVRLSDILVIAESTHGIKGFATAGFLNSKALFFPATMIMPKLHRKGIATFMWAIILNTVWDERLKAIGWRFWEYIFPLYFVFLTPNPQVYEIISKKLSLLPSIHKRKPSPFELALAKKAAELCSPGYKFDAETFVNEGVDLAHPELIYAIDEIPWASDRRINEFFERHLKLKTKAGNNFVVVGKINILQARIFYKNYYKNQLSASREIK
jgi:hypothetical protein